MCLLFESICIEKGIARNLVLHQERMRRSAAEVCEGSNLPELAQLIHLPETFDKERLIKCRVIYGKKIEKIEYDYYSPRKISSLKIVHDDQINYPHKFLDRSRIDALFTHRGVADDVLIVRNGLITDTSIANICLYDGSTWVTPATPLLQGTKRALLLQRGLIVEKDIEPENLKHYTFFSLINAMVELGEIVIENISLNI